MRLKKEYLLIVLVILGLLVYIYTRTSDRMNYELPNIASMQGDQVDRIVIEKPKTRIVLRKQEHGWVVGQRSYPVRPAGIDNLLASLSDLSLTDLVSRSENYARYGLDQSGAIQVTAWAGQEKLRSLWVGKAASTYRNAYVKLQEDPNIYLAKSNLQSTFDKTLADFQDRTVLSFDSETLQEITLQGSESSASLRRSDTRDATEAETAQAEQTPAWIAGDGRELAPSRVRPLLQSLEDLQCSAYLEDTEKSELTDPDYQVLLQGATKSGLNLFVKRLADNATEYRGTTLESDFPFRLSEVTGEKIQEAVENLLDPNQERGRP